MSCTDTLKNKDLPKPPSQHHLSKTVIYSYYSSDAPSQALAVSRDRKSSS